MDYHVYWSTSTHVCVHEKALVAFPEKLKHKDLDAHSQAPQNCRRDVLNFEKKITRLQASVISCFHQGRLLPCLYTTKIENVPSQEARC